MGIDKAIAKATVVKMVSFSRRFQAVFKPQKSQTNLSNCIRLLINTLIKNSNCVFLERFRL